MGYDKDHLERYVTPVLARLPGRCMKLYAALLIHRNSHGWDAWPSVSTLAAETRLKPRTVQLASAELVGAGVIWKENRRRGGVRYVFSKRALFSFPTATATPQPAPAETQPPLLMAMPDPVDSPSYAATDCGITDPDPAVMPQQFAAYSGVMPQQFAGPSEPVFKEEPVPPPAVSRNGHQRADASSATRTDGTGTEWNRNSEHEAALQLAGQRHSDQVAAMVDRLRERLGAWPRDETTASLHVAGALVAGWSVDAMVEDLRAGSTSAAVRDRGAVILANLATMAVRRPPYSTPARTGRYWPAWCGLCDKDGRFAGPKLRCENCHPSVAGRLPEPDSRADGWARTKDATTTAATPVAGSQRPVQPSWLNPHSPMGLDVQASLDAFYARETALQPTGTTGD